MINDAMYDTLNGMYSSILYEATCHYSHLQDACLVCKYHKTASSADGISGTWMNSTYMVPVIADNQYLLPCVYL